MEDIIKYLLKYLHISFLSKIFENTPYLARYFFEKYYIESPILQRKLAKKEIYNPIGIYSKSTHNILYSAFSASFIDIDTHIDDTKLLDKTEYLKGKYPFILPIICSITLKYSSKEEIIEEMEALVSNYHQCCDFFVFDYHEDDVFVSLLDILSKYKKSGFIRVSDISHMDKLEEILSVDSNKSVEGFVFEGISTNDLTSNRFLKESKDITKIVRVKNINYKMYEELANSNFLVEIKEEKIVKNITIIKELNYKLYDKL